MRKWWGRRPEPDPFRVLADEVESLLDQGRVLEAVRKMTELSDLMVKEVEKMKARRR